MKKIEEKLSGPIRDQAIAKYGDNPNLYGGQRDGFVDGYTTRNDEVRGIIRERINALSDLFYNEPNHIHKMQLLELTDLLTKLTPLPKTYIKAKDETEANRAQYNMEVNERATEFNKQFEPAIRLLKAQYKERPKEVEDAITLIRSFIEIEFSKNEKENY